MSGSRSRRRSRPGASGSRRATGSPAFGWLMIGTLAIEPYGPGVRDRERRALDLVGLQLMGSRPRREIGDRAREPDGVHPVGALDHRHDETGVVADRDAHVHVAMQHDRRRRGARAFTSGTPAARRRSPGCTNGRYVSLTPCLLLNASFARSRSRTRCSMLTSTIVHARAVVCSDASMCLRDRLADVRQGRDLVAARRPTGGRRCGGAGGRSGASADVSAAAGAGAGCRAAATAAIDVASFVMRPPVPIPAICARSRPCSSASLRTSGDRIRDRGPRSGIPRSGAGGSRLGGGALAVVASAPCGVAAHGGHSAAERSTVAAVGGGRRCGLRGGRSRRGCLRGARCPPLPGRRVLARAPASRRRRPSAVAPSATRSGAVLGDLGELGADRHGLALVDEDLRHRPGDRRGHLGVDLVGRDLEERLVALDRARPPSSATSGSFPR